MRSPTFYPLACVAAVVAALLTPGLPFDASAAQATAAGLASVVGTVIPTQAAAWLGQIFALKAG